MPTVLVSAILRAVYVLLGPLVPPALFPVLWDSMDWNVTRCVAARMVAHVILFLAIARVPRECLGTFAKMDVLLDTTGASVSGGVP